MSQKVVIYTRYSSDLQSTRSCVDQEREIRGGLAQKGVDHSEAVVIYDEAESGTKTFRNEFVRLQQMVLAGEVSILAVDDQSRLTRADNAFAFITDLVFAGSVPTSRWICFSLMSNPQRRRRNSTTS